MGGVAGVRWELCSHSLPVRQGFFRTPQDDGDGGGSLKASNGLPRGSSETSWKPGRCCNMQVCKTQTCSRGEASLLHTNGLPRTLVLDPEGS